jgi:cephalosporin hydroxylase
MDPIVEFENKKKENIEKLSKDERMTEVNKQWVIQAAKYNYSYNFSWMGRPIIAFPTDMIAMQEIIWSVKPDLIIETGIAHGGSIVYYASLLELIGEEGKVLGIDIDIRAHNKKLINEHPMMKRIYMIEGSSVDNNICTQVKDFAKNYKKIMVCLDSNHTHEHVLRELELYSQLVTKDSYLVVFDTSIEDYEIDSISERSWGKGNNPKTAVWEFLKHNDSFVIDKQIENKLLITVCADGFLKKIK